MNYRYLLIGLLTLGVVGCASTREMEYENEAENDTVSAIEQLINRVIEEESSSEESEPSVNELTDLVDIPELDKYIEEALQKNPSLQQSIIALNIAYATQGISRADLLPSVTSSFSGEKTQDSDDAFSADLTVSWELDLWQQLADTNEAAKIDILSTEASLQSAKNLVVANLMRGWLAISTDQQLLVIEQKRLEALKSTESLILERYRSGLDSLDELDTAKTATAQTKATIAEYQEQLEQDKRSLLLLTGGWNKELTDINVATRFPDVLYPLDSLSVQDLSGRPDLQQAFFDIKAQTLRTNAAYKAMLPSFSLSASLSDMAESPTEALFNNPIWNLLGQISAPLFQGGALRAQAEVEELTTRQSYWVYQEALLDAVNEVENAIGYESSYSIQQAHLRDALTSAERSLVSSEQNYRQGLVDIFDLLTVQQQAFDAEAELTSLIYQRLLNRIDLGLALGIGVSS
ncbi:TolC family protein [Marinomonas sp. 2405UD66-6]|uniref:TolC family protein n=1 Tax=Marinomonas sp. 2405UD66-6 TaxID=3391834 RepID=UPI0039C9C7E1